MKLQDLFRENLREVLKEHNIPLAEVLEESRAHSEKREFGEYIAAMAANKEARLENEKLTGEIELKQSELSALDGKISKEKADIKLIEDKRASMLVWAKKPESEKELFDMIQKNVTEHRSFTGQVSKNVPVSIWEHIQRFLKSYFKIEQENRNLRTSVSFQKVKEAANILANKNDIVEAAQVKADAIIKDADSVVSKTKLIKINTELSNRLKVYESVAERMPEFAEAVEQEKMRGNQVRVKGNRQEMAI